MITLQDPRWYPVLLRTGILALLIIIYFIWYRSSRASVLRAQFLLFSVLWFLLEVISWMMLHWVWPSFEKPSHLLFKYSPPVSLDRPPLYGHYDPDFDFWRRPNDSVTIARCSDQKEIKYKTNHLGLRDMEHTATSVVPRVIWLGDSFTEGAMVNVNDRASSWIQKWTKIPQINMGIRSSSTLNHYLIYRKLKSNYTHDAIVLGVLPANDLEDYQPEKKINILEYPIYRPYWDESGQIKYSLNRVDQAFGSLTRYNRPDLVYQTRDSLYRSLSLPEKLQVEITSNSYVWALIKGLALQNARHTYEETNSFDQEINLKAWQDFERSLVKLKEEANGKPILVAMYPTLSDIKTYQKNKSMRLADRIQALCQKHSLLFINTLPAFAQHRSPESLYVLCDGHWNEAGERMAAEILIKHPLFSQKNPGNFGQATGVIKK